MGFSSAGAGALGSLVLMNLTSLTPAQVVGTDLCFGLVVSSIGGAWHLSAGDYNSILLRGLALGGLAGVLLGAWLSSVLPARPLRAALSVALFWSGTGTLLEGLFLNHGFSGIASKDETGLG